MTMDYEYGEYYRRGHVPAFGSWDWNDAVPFTQCFETARQAGLLRYGYDDHLLAPAMIVLPRPPFQAKVGPRVKRATTTKQHCVLKAAREDDAPTVCPTPAPKPVDEDLYKISPELLKSKPKRGNGGFGCFSRCFFPTRVL